MQGGPEFLWLTFTISYNFMEIGALSQGNKFCNKVCLSFVSEKVFRSFTTAVGGFKSGSFVFFIDDFLSDVRFAFARRTCNGF